MIEVGKGSALAAVEDGATANCERTVCTDGEAGCEKGVRLQYVIELELLVGDDLTLSIVLIGKDTVLEDDDWGVGAYLSPFESLLALGQMSAVRLRME